MMARVNGFAEMALSDRSIGSDAGLGAAEALQAIAKTQSQGLEFMGEVPPVADARGIQRLPYLFGTCRAHRPLGRMEAEAGRLERQAAMREQAANVRLRIADQILVLQMHDFAGQHIVPMIHELKIAAKVAAEIAEVV